jgi:hypothetical protein
MQVEQWGASNDTGTLFCIEVMVAPKKSFKAWRIASHLARLEFMLLKKPIVLVTVFELLDIHANAYGCQASVWHESKNTVKRGAIIF